MLDGMESILSGWNFRCGQGFLGGWSGQLTTPVKFRDLAIAKKRIEFFPEYDWCFQGDLEKLDEDPPWLWEPRKGSQHTAQLLAENRENEEVVALIYIGAVCFDLKKKFPEAWRGDNYGYVKEVWMDTRGLFKERGLQYWHHLMTDALPATSCFAHYVSESGLSLNCCSDVIDFAFFAASHTCSKNTLVRYVAKVEQGMPPKSDRAGG